MANRSQRARSLLVSIADIARRLDPDLVAEGIETEDQF
ncbi:MAG: hypothetical protein AAF404_06515 [Pseudomonadota bacterium]